MRIKLLVVLMFYLLLMSPQIYAQGRLTGNIVEKGSEQGMIGANITIDGTTIGTRTDNQGHYLINNLDEGSYSVTVQFIGYKTEQQEVTIESGKVSMLNFEMVQSVLQMDQVVISAERFLQSQSAALNEQYNAANIKNVISSDLIGSFPDEEAVEAIARIPGVFVNGSEAIIRGLPADWALTTVNGEKIPAVNAAEDRHASLETFPVDLIQAIEVSKGQTADLDADAIGGNINFILKDAPNGPLFNVRAYQGWSTNQTSDYSIDQFNYFGPSKASMTIGDVMMDGKMAYSISGTYEVEARSEYAERTYWYFDEKNWDRYNGLTDVNGNSIPRGVRRVREAPTETIEKRAGFNTALVWRPELGHKMTLKTFYSSFNLTDYDLEFTDDYSKGEIEKLNDVKNEPKHVLNVALGGKHLFMNDWNVDYNLQFTSGRGGENHDFQGSFVSEYGTPNEFHFDNHNHENESFEEDEYIAALNITKPLITDMFGGFLKFGGKYKYKDRYNQKLDSELVPADENTVDWVISRDDDFIIEWAPPLGMLLETETDTDVDENYTASEKIAAGYFMAELWLNKNFMILPGIRFENTNIESKTRVVNPLLPGYDNFENGSASYTDVFPSLHLRYNFPYNLVGRISASKGIARPSYRYFAGFNAYNAEDQELFTGNPELEPTRSWNFDVIVEHYAPNQASHISAGLFYKDIDNVIVEKTFNPENGTFNGYDVSDGEVTQPQNIETGQALGVEFSIQRQLDFIGFPEIGILANLTHQIDTFTEDEDGKKQNLPQQAEDVINLALSYESSNIGFSGRLSYRYASEIFLTNLTNAERWLEAGNYLDLSLRQRLFNGVNIFFNANNLLGDDRKTIIKVKPEEGVVLEGAPSEVTYHTFFREPEFYAGFNVAF